MRIFRFFSGVFEGSRRNAIVCLLFCLILSQPLCGWNRQAARQAYQKAARYHEQLLQAAEQHRTLSQHRQAVFLYRRVVDHDPTYGACDDALYTVATLFEQMAALFKNDSYRRRAIYYYEFVADQYPLTKYKDTALEKARLLRQPVPRPPPDLHSDLATVSEIRYWSSEEYTRVVIQLDREAEFQKHVLHNPDRIYFDLQNTRLISELVGKAYSVNDLLLKQIRVAQNRKALVRVVLDFEEIHKHTVFALYDPFRIVIDTRGDRPAAAASPSGKKQTVRTAEAVIPRDSESARREATREIPAVPSPNLGGDRSLTRVLGLKIGRVVIDPGHGGVDTGTIGPTGLREKDLVLAVGLRLRQLLKERLGTDVILTRSTDKFVSLEERTAIANQHAADLFLSIHANSSQHRQVTGVETFFLNFASTASEREVASRENATSQRNISELEDLLRKIALGDYNEESRDLAHVVQKSLYTRIKSDRPALRNRGVKKAPFIVLIGSNMPSILTEVSFLSNASDEKYLKTGKARYRIAEALYQGIETYFRSLGAVPLYERVSADTSP